MLLANTIVFCLFHYVFGRDTPSFGLHDLSGPDLPTYLRSSNPMKYGVAPMPPRSEDGETMQQFMDRQIRNERIGADEPTNYLRSREPGPFNYDARIPGPPDFSGPPRTPRIPGFPETSNDFIGGRFRPGSPSGNPPPQDWTVPGQFPAHYGNRPNPMEQLKQGPYTGTKQEAAYDINALGSRLTAAGKWEEFIKLANEVKKKRQGGPPENWEDDALTLAQYSRNLVSSMPKHEEEEEATTPKGVLRVKHYSPSPGMAAYWNNDDRPKPVTPKPYRKPAKMMTGEDVMKLAMMKLAAFEQSENSSPLPQSKAVIVFPQNETNATVPAPPALNGTSQSADNQSDFLQFKRLPKFDDFNSPIRWVPLYSKETSEGLARVTDPKTGKNRQYVINGSVMVPVIDYSVERLGLTTTTTMKTVPASDPGALRTILRNVDLKNADRSDWLAYEVALGTKRYNNRCEGEGCGARCHRLGCESQCSGDTCSTGCVGGSCSTMCTGPGCMSMCIGENCSAKCHGMACEARCRGKGCEATCRSFSCAQIANGSPALGGGTFDQHYPQYSAMPQGDANYFTSY